MENKHLERFLERNHLIRAIILSTSAGLEPVDYALTYLKMEPGALLTNWLDAFNELREELFNIIEEDKS